MPLVLVKNVGGRGRGKENPFGERAFAGHDKGFVAGVGQRRIESALVESWLAREVPEAQVVVGQQPASH